MSGWLPTRRTQPTARQMFTASVSHGDVLDAINRLEEAVCGIYRDAEVEAYSGNLSPAFLAIKVRGRLADAFAECGDRLNATRAIPQTDPTATALTHGG